MATINSKIDENETLANMKKYSVEGASQAATYMTGLFGWGGATTAAADLQAAQPEEVKVEAAGHEMGEITEEIKDVGGAASMATTTAEPVDDGFGEPQNLDRGEGGNVNN